MTTAATILPVTVTLADPLSTVATAPVRRRIEDELSTLLRDLGVEAALAVEVRADPSPPRKHLIRVEVSGRPCRLSRTAIFEALAYVEATPLVAEDLTPAAVLDRLGGPGTADAERLGELAGLVCRAAVSAQPDVLLPGGDPLAPALALGISIAGADAAALRGPTQAGPIEPLIAELAAPAVELAVEPRYFQALTLDGAGDELFPAMRDGLFTELGLGLARMHIRLDPSLRRAGFAFRFNGVRTIPRIGLAPDTILVNDTVERLKLMNFEGQPTVNPGSGQPAAIVAREHEDMLEASGLTIWDPFRYFILALAAAIRRNAYVLMTKTAADAMMEQLSAAFPAVTDAARRCGIHDTLAPMLRELLRDRVSIRNLRRILELLVRRETAPEETDIADRIRVLRTGLADQITHALAPRNTLVAYLLAPDIDDVLAGHGHGLAGDWSDDTVTEQLCDAVYTELNYLPKTATTPVILTSDSLRGTVQTRLRHEFPHLSVVSYGEVPDGVNVQPVARISWST